MNHLQPTPLAEEQHPETTAWDIQWAEVPSLWRTGSYEIDTAPFNEVFTQNNNYHAGRSFSFAPTIGPKRLGHELSWWVYVCWKEGLRKIEPSMLNWWRRAVDLLVEERISLTGKPPATLAALPSAVVVDRAIRLFFQRNNRFPSPGNRRNLVSIAEHINLLVAARTSDLPWHSNDNWSLSADDRIPRRPHEPKADVVVRLGSIKPTWLREGARFWLSTSLTYNVYSWSTITKNAYNLASRFSPYLLKAAIDTPVISTDEGVLRNFFTDYLSWLRSPEATSNRERLSDTTISAAQGLIQAYYDFMYDHRREAADFTADPRWLNLTPLHTRLWTPLDRASGSRRHRAEQTTTKYIAPSDLTAMIACIEILKANTNEIVTVNIPGRAPIQHQGLGDPQAARIWLLQAMTGRRASEILMLDFHPLSPIPGTENRTREDDFVARLRYQQTKIEGANSTILVQRAVVDLIHEQQDWVRKHVLPSPDSPAPPYLFPGLRNNHKGLKPRTYTSYSKQMSRLDQAVALTDTTGKPLKFTSTHRLRHTRATELLNSGVPVHVVQDYMGHRSPEMTMHYARTLAKTAEAEFLRARSLGAFAADLGVDRRDLYEITQLEGRVDRILPAGACLLPPAQSCDKGNACLTCPCFATDPSHTQALKEQRRSTIELIEIRNKQFNERHGQPMPETNVWMQARRQEIHSLDAILEALHDLDDEQVVRNKGERLIPSRDKDQETHL